jgi:hypothetical protein
MVHASGIIVVINTVVIAIVMTSLAFRAVAIFLLVLIVPVEWRSVVNPYKFARPVSIVAITGWQPVSIIPAATLRKHIDLTGHIVIDALLREVIIVVIARIPLLPHYGTPKLNSNLRLTRQTSADSN